MGRTLPEALLSKLWLRHPLQMFMFVPPISLFFLSSCVNVHIIRHKSTLLCLHFTGIEGSAAFFEEH